MKKIGITKEQCIPGIHVNYYFFYDDVTGEHSEPIYTKITSGPYKTSGVDTCFVFRVSGVVALSHLEIIKD